MSTRFSVVVLASAAAMFVACEKNPSQSVGPSAVAAAPASVVNGSAQAAAKGAVQHVVTIFDACDPDTFNAVLGAGSCTRSGGVQFDKFLEQLTRHHSIGAWHFAPSEVSMQVGQLLVAENQGGETHTFTEVDEFGGGIVPVLNQAIGLTDVAPECSALAPGDFIAPGASSSEKEAEAGTEKYQCCIHPWMRAEVRIAAK